MAKKQLLLQDSFWEERKALKISVCKESNEKKKKDKNNC